MSNESHVLPEGFRELQPYVAYWAKDSNDQRRVARSSASMDEIQRFYDAITGRAEEATRHVEQYEIGQMPADAECLFKLLLAMNHAAIAVEMHGQPVALDSVWPSPVRVTQGPWPHGTTTMTESRP